MTKPTAVYDKDGNIIGKERLLHHILEDVLALSSADKAKIWNDLNTGKPKKYGTSYGKGAGAILALDWSLRESGATPNALQAAQQRIMALYVSDNPQYLENPPFAPLVNVKGYDPV
jgi:hypothetical protein